MRMLFQDVDRQIRVYETHELFGEKGAFRVLQFADDAVQGVLDLNRPERVVFEYAQAMIHLMKANDPLFEDVFIIGHGAGTIAAHFADKRVRVAEIDEQIVELGRRFFGYAADNVAVGDGRLLLAEERSRSLDYILLDAFTSAGTPRHLTSREFFRLAADKLGSWGAIVLNLIGNRGNDAFVNAVHATLSLEFPCVTAFAHKAARDRGIRNVVMVGGRKPARSLARHMAGFAEIKPAGGHVIVDADSDRDGDGDFRAAR